MSIDNIFKCCKKNYIITGITGIILGGYGSYYGLSNFLGPINVETTPADPVPVSPPISPPISQPVTVPLKSPVTFKDLFFNSATLGTVGLIGGLAVLTYGTSRLIMSRQSYDMLTGLRQAVLEKRGLNQNEINKIENAPQPTKEDFKKLGSNQSNVEKLIRENEELKGDLNKYKDILENAKKKFNLSGFDFFGGVKTVTFVKPVITSDIFEVDEKEEVMDLKPRQDIILSTNELLAKAEGNAKVFVETKLFTAYEENIKDLGEGRVLEDTNEVAIDEKAIIDLFSVLKLNRDVTIQQLLTENVEISQRNIALDLSTTSYNDLNTFIYYGAKTLVGTPYISIGPESITYNISAMQMVDLPKNKIGYLNAPKASVLLKISGQGANFVTRLTYQFMYYIIPIFSRITAAGIGRFDSELARLLYTAANNKFTVDVKIVKVPQKGEKEFFNQFLDFTILKSIYNLEQSQLLDDKNLMIENLSKEGIIVNEITYNKLIKVQRFKDEFDHVYKVMMDMLNKRDSYIDLIKIYDRIYKLFHEEDYNKANNIL